MEVWGHNIEVANELGYYSFIAFIVLILLYLLKPKPFQKVIPSLMFLEKVEKKVSVASFFKKFIKDWLFVFQFLVILLLCLATLGLFTFVDMAVKPDEVVLVVDASASSKANEAWGTRFSRYTDIARDNLGGKNSVIMIKDSPQLMAKGVNAREASSVLSRAKASDSRSNVWDAMILASDISEDKNSKIVVISDFADTNGKNILRAKEILETKGHEVALINPSFPKDNVGIVSYRIVDDKVEVDIQNFGKSAKTFTTDSSSEPITMLPNSIETITVPLKEGPNEIRIQSGDALEADDTLYLYMPKSPKLRTLVLTNKPDTYLQKALSSIRGMEITISQPPIIPSLDYDVIVMDQVDTSKILPGTIGDIEKKVRAGSSFIVAAQEDIRRIEFGAMVPLTLYDSEKTSTPIINTRDVEELADIDFGQSSRIVPAERRGNQSAIIAEAVTGTPMVSLSRLGEGYVLYYGILDNYNGFKLSPDYPLFWIRVIERIRAKQSASSSNLKIGDTIFSSGSEKVIDPDGSRFDSYTVADRVGFYKIGDRMVASNLLNQKESDLTGLSIEREDFSTGDAQAKANVKLDLLPFVVAAAILFILVEVYYVKRRGDL